MEKFAPHAVLHSSVDHFYLSIFKNTRMRYLIPVLAFLLLASACKEKKYCACCENAATSASFPIPPTPDSLGVTEALIYIPNIFVYSGDFADEQFMPFANQGVVEIVSARYTDKSGNELFLAEHFLPNDIVRAWNGFTTGGSRFEGAFEYEVVVLLTDGEVKTLTGSACAYPCGDKGFPNGQLDNCRFPTQNNGYGGFDPTLYKPAETCFE